MAERREGLVKKIAMDEAEESLDVGEEIQGFLTHMGHVNLAGYET